MSDLRVRITLAAESPLPSYNVAPWVSGVLAVTGEAPASGWVSGLLADCSEVGESADIAAGGNYVQVSDWDVALLARTAAGVAWWDAMRTAGASIIGATLEVLDGTTAKAVGVVTDASLSGAEVSLSVEAVLTRRERTIPAKTITKAEFPDVQESAVGQPVPIVYGPVVRLNAPRLDSDTEYMTALRIATTEGGVRDLDSTVIADIGAPSVPTMTTTLVPILYGIASTAYTDLTWPTDGDLLFVEVVGGTGSGQTRMVKTIGATGMYDDPSGAYTHHWASIIPTEAFTTLPDATSSIRIYSGAVAQVLATCDDGVVSSIYDPATLGTIPFQERTESGVVIADASGEFRDGTDLRSTLYCTADNVWSNPTLSDGTYGGYDVLSSAHGVDLCESIAIMGDNIPQSALNGAEGLALLFGASWTDATLATRGELVLMGRTWYGAWRRLCGPFVGSELGRVYVDLTTDGTRKYVNAYSPAMAADGGTGLVVGGNYNAAAIEVTLPAPLGIWRELRAAIISAPSGSSLPSAWTDLVSAGALDSTTLTTGQTYVVANAPDTSDYPWAPETPYPVGCLVRPAGRLYRHDGSDLTSYGDPILSTMGYDTDWRVVYGSVYLSSGRYGLTLSHGWDFGVSSIDAPMLAQFDGDSGDMPELRTYEAGFAVLGGSISPTTEMVVDFASGRDAATNAPDAAVDILERDLGLSSAEIDSTAFASLPDDSIRMAIVQQESSSSVLARMAREYHWIIGHNGAGKVRPVTWLDRLWSTSQDWTIANADILRDSISEGMTAIEDVVGMLCVDYDWTPYDGFRESAAVARIDADPGDLTSSNYKTYLSGWGDYATSLALYARMHTAWTRHQTATATTVDLKCGRPLSALTGNYIEWACQRKRTIDLNVRDSHAASACIVGDRVKITHRRYAPSAVYGTIAGRWWHPTKKTVQILAILDPEVIA